MATQRVKAPVKPFDHIQAVTFDVGGTLIRPWPSVGHIYAEVAKRHGFTNISAELLNHNFATAWQAKKNFNHTRSDWSDLVGHTFSSVLPGPVQETFFDDLYERFTDPDCWKVYEDVIPTLEELRMREFRLAIISNWDERLKILLPRLNLASFFETVIVSCEVGFPKPSAVIFEYASRKLGLALKSILHVGDTASEDYDGAKATGFAALLLDRNAEEKGHTISSLQHVPHFI